MPGKYFDELEVGMTIKHAIDIGDDEPPRRGERGVLSSLRTLRLCGEKEHS